MAIDTENKRRSVSGYTGNPIYPVADGTIGTQDRPHVAWLYSGIVIGLAFSTYSNNIARVLFRDKRAEILFRVKRKYSEFRDKRVIT